MHKFNVGVSLKSVVIEILNTVRPRSLNIKTEMTISWDIETCSPVYIDRRFRGAYCLHHQGDETSVNI
jgi:hypothetical protein